MSYDLKNKLVIGISSRALFNLEEENVIFARKRDIFLQCAYFL